MNHTRKPLLVLALSLLAFIASATGAYALWNTTATATLNVATAAAAPPAAPDPPSGITCLREPVSGESAVRIGWSAVAGATSYEVWRVSPAPVAPVKTGITALNALVTKSDAGNHNNVQLAVRAVHAGGTSTNGSPVLSFNFNASSTCGPTP